MYAFSQRIDPRDGFKSKSTTGPKSTSSMVTRSSVLLRTRVWLCDVATYYPRSISDVSIFTERGDVHLGLTRKSAEEENIDDFGEDSAAYPRQWAILVDKGYQGAQAICRTIQPKKKPTNGQLSNDDIQRNKRVSSDRVLVDNYFGRLCTLWKIMVHTYKWDEDKYDLISRVCYALTNFHAAKSPLRAEDNAYFQRILGRYHEISDYNVGRAARNQARYRERQRRRRLEQVRTDYSRHVRARASFQSPDRSSPGYSQAYSLAF